MLDDVKACVDSRLNFLENYYEITPENRDEVEAFVHDIIALGERCTGYAKFEEKFVAEGLSTRFAALVSKQPAKKHKMTKEEKQFAKSTFKEIISQNKKQIITDAVRDVADGIRISAESEMIKQNRDRMIADGTFDDYTRATNATSDARDLFGFIKRRLKK